MAWDVQDTQDKGEPRQRPAVRERQWPTRSSATTNPARSGARCPAPAPPSRSATGWPRLPLDELKRRAANADAELRDLGITFTVYSETRRGRPRAPLRLHPARPFGGGLGDASRRACASASPRSTTCCTTSTTTQKILADGVIPADLILGNANYRPIMRGVDLPHRTYVNVCGTDIVRDGSRRLPGAGGQRPHAVRRRLRRREPAHDDARLPRPAGRASGCARSPTTAAAAARRCARWRRRRRRPAGGAALARPVQLRLLRARLPRARDGRAAGRGPRPRGRGRRPGVDAHDRRPRPRRGDLPAHRRRLPRPGGVPRRTAGSACPA